MGSQAIGAYEIPSEMLALWWARKMAQQAKEKRTEKNSGSQGK